MTVVDRDERTPDPVAKIASTDELATWRFRALTQQLPSTRFPAGSQTPAIVYLLASVLLATAAVLAFAAYDRAAVPAAVRQSQRDLMVKVAHSIDLSVGRSDETFNQAVGSLTGHGTPRPAYADVLGRLTSGPAATWSGAAVVKTSTRQAVTASGQPVPMNAVAAGPRGGRLAVITTDGPAIVRTAPIGPDRLLVGLEPTVMRTVRPNPDAQQGIFMITRDGQNNLIQGVNAVPPATLTTILRDYAGIRSSRSHTVAVREWSNRDLVVSAAPVGDTGLVVASVIVADVVAGPSLKMGLTMWAAIVLAALGAFLLMWFSLVRPLRALLYEAKVDASGALSRRRPALRVAEAYRVARALAVSSDANPGKYGWRPTVTQGIAAAVLIGLLGPAFAVFVSLERPLPPVPAQLIRDEESRAEAVSHSLGSALSSGVQTVARVNQDNPALGAGTARHALRSALAANNRLRGVYLVGPRGAVLASAGRTPLRDEEPLPPGESIALAGHVHRLPVIYAYQTRPDGTAVVAEYDIDYLLDLVRRTTGRAIVVDPQLRTVLDSEGYRAFQPVADGTRRSVAAQTGPGRTVSRTTDTGRHAAMVVGTAMNDPAVAHLGWAVVLDRNVGTLLLPQSLERRWVLLTASGAAGLVLVALAWQFFVIILPLRRLADASDRISEGDFDEPVVPQRHDDVGAVATCLEICRQVRHTGSARFGGAVRLRGSATNMTAVLPRPAKRGSPERAGA